MTSDTDDEEELLTVRHQTKEEMECEEKDYIRWLKGEENKISQQQAADMVREGSQQWPEGGLFRGCMVCVVHMCVHYCRVTLLLFLL